SVARITTAGAQIGLIEVDRLGHRDRSVAGILAGAARSLARRVDRLPVSQDMDAVGRLEIIAKAEAFDPVRAAGGAVDIPGARPRVATITSPDVRPDRDP